jgi:hypothetical protein
LLFAPTLIWNAQHHWESILYQSVSRTEEGSFKANQLYKFPVRQLKLITPVLCVWAWGCGAAALFRWKRADWRDRFLAAVGLPILIFFLLMIFATQIKGYWPGPGYLSLLVLSSAVVLRGGVWPLRLHVASLAVMAVFHLAMPIVMVASVPTEERRSWERFAGEISREPGDFLVCDEYHLAAQLAFHRRSLDVWDFSPVNRGVKSFRNWWSPGKYAGKNATIVIQTENPSPADLDHLRSFFERIDPPVEVTVRRPRSDLLKDNENKERYLVLRAWNYRPRQ